MEKGRFFICDMCLQRCYTETPLSDIREEYIKNYGHTPEESDEEHVRLCTHCYTQVMAFKDEKSSSDLISPYCSPQPSEPCRSTGQ